MVLLELVLDVEAASDLQDTEIESEQYLDNRDNFDRAGLEACHIDSRFHTQFQLEDHKFYKQEDVQRVSVLGVL